MYVTRTPREVGRALNPARQIVGQMNLQPGTKLGKYDLIRRIGVGGMAELYLASTRGIEGFEKLVALKRILPHFADNDEVLSMFLDEARLAAALNHQNIAQVNDIGVEGNSYFIVMEYVHGVDLQKLLRAGRRQHQPLTLECAIIIISEVAAGLHYAHDKVGPDGQPYGLVHRDVSPQNIIVSYDGSVKLVDFGIAKATRKAQRTTSTGSLKGKLAYMSPEQAVGKQQLDRRSDVFALGIVLWELTTGKQLFDENSSYELLKQIVDYDAPSPRTVFAEYPPALENIVMGALTRDRDKRYQSAQKMRQDLEDFAHEYRLRMSSTVLASYMEELFGKKLDEWRTARAQSMQDVEAHVVETLAGLQSSCGDTAQVPKVDITIDGEDEDEDDGEDDTDTTEVEELDENDSSHDALFQHFPNSFDLQAVSLPPSYPQAAAVPRRGEHTARVTTLTRARRQQRRRRVWIALMCTLVGGLIAALILWSDNKSESELGQPAATHESQPHGDSQSAGEQPESPAEPDEASLKAAVAPGAEASSTSSSPTGEDNPEPGQIEDHQAEAGETPAEVESGQARDNEVEPGRETATSKPKNRKKRRKKNRRKRNKSNKDSDKKKNWDPNSPFMPDP